MVLNHSTIISNRHTTYAIIFPETSLKARAYIRAGKQLLTKIEKPDATYSKAPIASVGQQRKDQAMEQSFYKNIFHESTDTYKRVFMYEHNENANIHTDRMFKKIYGHLSAFYLN